jgi:hypothetical protein
MCGEMYCLHCQCSRVIQANKNQETRSLLPDYTLSFHGSAIHSHCQENLKSNKTYLLQSSEVPSGNKLANLGENAIKHYIQRMRLTIK